MVIFAERNFIGSLLYYPAKFCYSVNCNLIEFLAFIPPLLFGPCMRLAVLYVLYMRLWNLVNSTDGKRAIIEFMQLADEAK